VRRKSAERSMEETSRVGMILNTLVYSGDRYMSSAIVGSAKRANLYHAWYARAGVKNRGKRERRIAECTNSA